MHQKLNWRNGMIATMLMLITVAPLLAFLNDSCGATVPDQLGPALVNETREQDPNSNGTVLGSDAVVGEETVSVSPHATASPSLNVSGNGSSRMTVPEQVPVERPAEPEDDTGWKTQYARYPELTELREHSVKHFDLGNGKRIAIVSGGLLHYYDGAQFEEIPDLPFPEGMMIENSNETHVLTFPDWCTVRADEDGAVVRAYDASGMEIYTLMHPFIVPEGVSPYKPVNMRYDAAAIANPDDEPDGALNILDEDAVTYCAFAVEGNNLYLVLPRNTTYPVQAYDATASGTNNKDAYINKYYPNENYYTGKFLYIRAGNSSDNRIQRIVMGWRMPDGTGTITGVNLSLWKDTTSGDGSFAVEVHELNETGFVETEVTWNNRTATDLWDGAGCSGSSSNATVVDSVQRTQSVDEWHTWWLLGGDVNNPMDLTWNEEFEILLKESATLDSTNYERFRSKETDNESQRPYLTITYETDVPQWSNLQTNKTTIYPGDSVKFTANWTDNLGLAGYIFSINQSGTWVNSSYVPFSGTSNTSENVTVITANRGSPVQWRFYANDTTNIWAETPVQTFLVAPVTPFIIYGWVYYENGSACTNPQVNITNLNTSATWQAQTNLSDNYYQLVLASGTDVNATERLQVQVAQASSDQSRHVIYTVSAEDVARGGLLPYNISLLEPGRQTWYFTTNEADGPRSALATYNKTMTKGVEGGNTTVTLAPGECVWFYADEQATCTVTFPPGAWDVSYWVIASGSGTLTTRLQNLAPGGGNTTIAENTSSITDTAGALQEIDLALTTDASFSVPAGGRFALELCWSAAAGNLEIHCNPPERYASSIASPSADPGYPVPELPSLILLCAGVLTLAGYLALHRRPRARE